MLRRIDDNGYIIYVDSDGRYCNPHRPSYSDPKSGYLAYHQQGIWGNIVGPAVIHTDSTISFFIDGVSLDDL